MIDIIEKENLPSATERLKSDLLISLGSNSSWISEKTSSYPKISLRKGKWLEEEEIYTKKLIEAFNLGYLNVPNGTTLRSFLSERLCCDPMRITKKFTGSSCIGKQIYSACEVLPDVTILKELEERLLQLEEKFRAKIEIQYSLSLYPIPSGLNNTQLGQPVRNEQMNSIHSIYSHCTLDAFLNDLYKKTNYNTKMTEAEKLQLFEACVNNFTGSIGLTYSQFAPRPLRNIDVPNSHNNSVTCLNIDISQNRKRPIEEIFSSQENNTQTSNHNNHYQNKRTVQPKSSRDPPAFNNAIKKPNKINDLYASDLLLNFYKSAKGNESMKLDDSCSSDANSIEESPTDSLNSSTR